MKKLWVVTILVVALCGLPALAQITVGVNLSTTGAAASMGIPQKNLPPFWPRA